MTRDKWESSLNDEIMSQLFEYEQRQLVRMVIIVQHSLYYF